MQQFSDTIDVLTGEAVQTSVQLFSEGEYCVSLTFGEAVFSFDNSFEYSVEKNDNIIAVETINFNPTNSTKLIKITYLPTQDFSLLVSWKVKSGAVEIEEPKLYKV